MQDEGLNYKTLPQIFFIFALSLSYDLSMFSDDFTRFFFYFEKP